MTLRNPRLLTPPREEEIAFPYRRVWRSIIIENGTLIAFTIVLIFIGGLIPSNLYPTAALIVAITPLGLWFVFSWFPEKSVSQPRPQILRTMIITGLVANAVGLPLIRDFFVIESWLPTTDLVSRITGYTLTVGITQELLKYIVLRFLVWPGLYRYRMDAIAYGLAGAVGYGTVLALHFVVENNPPPDIAAVRVVGVIVPQVISSAVMAYGLAQARFSDALSLLMGLTFALAALLTGFFIPVLSSISNATFVPGIAGTAPIRALLFAIVTLVGALVTVAFLLNNAERRDQEAASEPE